MRYSLYDRKRLGKLVFMLVSVGAIIIFLLISNSLVKSLAAQERERMEIWADATQRLVQQEAGTDIEFLFSIIEQNNTIPVMMVDADGNVLEFRNFNLPDAGREKLTAMELTDRDREYLESRMRKSAGPGPLAQTTADNPHFMRIRVFEETYHYIYYEDSDLLRRLAWYPYIQLGVMIFLAIIVLMTIVYTKRAEQNRVWVGLSKETAHQLGTPISSLMAWSQLLDEYGVPQDVVTEIDKDVHRLSVIADRFGKIGSIPELELEYLNDTVERSLDYMRSRISGRVEIRMELSPEDHGVMLSRSLMEWVMENLTKNAVDAMEGAGTLTIATGSEKGHLYIDISDTGKGIARKNFKNVFNPGFTTKKRGWGLGLTLVKRIVEEYHGGRIYVLRSEPGRGTTFRIELPEAR